MKGIRALLATLVLAAGLVTLIAGLWSQSDRLAAAYWRNRLAQVPDDQVAVLLNQIDGWGEDSIPVLVEALNSPRPRIAQESREMLWAAMAQWDRLATEGASRRRRILAESLVQQVDGFRPSAQVDAAQLASQLLMRPIDQTVVPAWRVTAACERVLVATEPARMEHAKTLAAALAGSAKVPTPSKEQVEGPPRPNQPASVPPGQEQESQAPKMAAQDRSEPAAALNRPSRLLSQFQGPAVTGTDSPPALLPSSNPTAGNPARDHASSKPQGIIREMPKPAEELPSVEPETLNLPEPVGISADTVDLMRNLRSTDPATASAAQAELRRRGFSEVQLELGLRLFDPDAEVRKQLVQVLPEMRSLDATPWLLQLCRDPNPDVRRSAFSLMATTTDPRLVERLLQIARQDSDPTIRRHAERLASGRDEARRPASGRRR